MLAINQYHLAASAAKLSRQIMSSYAEMTYRLAQAMPLASYAQPQRGMKVFIAALFWRQHLPSALDARAAMK